MSKILDASCQAGIVTIAGTPIPGAVILSEGIGPSTGFAVIDADKVYYIAKTSPDLKTAMTNLNTILTQILAILTTLDGVTVSPGTAAPAIVATTLLNTQFGLTKELLK
jgi:hypothetical protein